MRSEKLKKILALLVLGATSLVFQIILIRELITSFYGNELFISLVLAFWLISTGFGSLFFAEIISERFKGRSVFFYSLAPFVFFLSLMLARLSRMVLGGGGVMPNLILASLWALAVVFPLGVVVGALFVFLAGGLSFKKEQSVSLAYVAESLGFFIGALVFDLFLFRFSGLEVVLLAASLIFLTLAIFRSKNLKLTFLFLAIFIVSIFLFVKSEPLDRKLDSWRYPGSDLIISSNTRYGSVQTVRSSNGIDLYQNGNLSDRFPNTFHNESMVHLPMAAIKELKQVLVIGNAFTGIIDELEKYSPKKISYLEMDKEYINQAQRAGFDIPSNVEVINEDFNDLLQGSDEIFDLIIVNHSDPVTLSDNRYFTDEFFALASEHLSLEGILCLKLNTAPKLSASTLEEIMGTTYATLKRAFDWVMPLPEDNIVFLASRKNDVIIDWKAVYDRDKTLALNNEYLTPDLIKWRFYSDRTEEAHLGLSADPGKVNSYFKPTLFYQQLVFFLGDSKAGNFFGWLIFFFVILFGLALWLVRGRGKDKILLLSISAAVEFSLLAFEVMLIMIFQAYHGYIYGQLSLMISLVLLGIAAGSLLSCRLLQKIEPVRLLRLSTFFIFLCFSAFLFLVWGFEYLLGSVHVYLLSSFAISLAVGTKFPVINKLYLKEGSRLGAIYGIDLFGASIGALAASIVIIPMFGVVSGLLFLSLLCLAAFSISLDID